MFNKVTSILLASFLIFAAISCGEKEKDVDLTFKVQYDGQPLVMSLAEYTNPNGMNMIITKFSAYLSNITIGDVTSDEVKFIDFSQVNTSTSLAEAGFTMTMPVAEGGEYSTLSFDIGISPELNAMIPADFDASHPLSMSSEYWGGWQSYIFTKTEGKIDSNDDGMFDTNMALHLGSDTAKRTITLNGTFDAGGENNSVIVIDLKKLFEGDNGIYDIIGTPAIHQTDQVPQLIELSDNLSKAISVE